jgi:hypothetical protein
MASTFDKLIGNNFHTWKMKMEFLLHDKDLWEIISRKLLPSKTEFEKIIPEGSVHKHRMFMQNFTILRWKKTFQRKLILTNFT